MYGYPARQGHIEGNIATYVLESRGQEWDGRMFLPGDPWFDHFDAATGTLFLNTEL